MSRDHRKKPQPPDPATPVGVKDPKEHKPSLLEVAGTKWKELLVGGIIGWILSTAAFFITPYSDFLKYRVAGEYRPFGKPTMNNLTGDWSITIEQKSGVFDGTLHLEQGGKDGKALNGHYSGNLNSQSGYHGTVLRGHADEAVTVILMWDSGTRYWSIVGADKKQEDGRINLRSTTASLFEICPRDRCPDGWERKEDGIKVHAVADRY